VTSPACVDPASEIVTVFIAAMRGYFAPDSECPPDGGGTTAVRFFAGDGALPAWEPHGSGCDAPFLWVRAARRYRSKASKFPAAHVGDGPCGEADVIRVLAVEIGVGRCTSMTDTPNWDTLADEAEISLDDSWRIEQALCWATKKLRQPNRAVATDTVEPFGPEGGIVAWTGMAFVQI